MADLQKMTSAESIPQGAVVIDLREETDYAAGHIPGALRIAPESLREEIRRIARFNTPILLYCYTGRKSAQAAEMLQSRGYENARDLGGIGAWQGELEPELTIRELREKKGLSQAALARMIGVRQPTVAAYESGKAYPGPEIRETIRRVLFVTLAPPNRPSSEPSAPRKEGKGRAMSIRELRKNRHLTQAEFAESIGICAGSVAGYEAGRTVPGSRVAARIREVYGVDVLIPGKGPKTNQKDREEHG